jgi:multidrug resistance efflux pump
MKAETLGSSSPPSAEVNYRAAVSSHIPPGRRWRCSLALSLGVLVLLASFVVAAISLHSHASPSSASPTSAVAPTDDKRWYSLGYVDNEGGVTPLYPLQPGRVKSIDVKENELVKAGTPLFHLDDTVPLLKVRQAQSDLEGARKQLAIAEAGVDEANKQIAAQKIAIDAARKKVEQARLLRDKQKKFARDGIADKEMTQAAEITLEQAELAVQGEEAKLAIAEAAKRKAEGYVAAAKDLIAAKQAQLDEARHAVSECVVRAPVEGTPLRILVTVGETLGPNPRQPAVQFAPAGPLLVRAEVEQEFVSRVRPNQSVIVEDNVTGQECARGTVASLALWYAPRRTFHPEIVPLNSDNSTLECVVHIDTISRPIRIGQRVRVQFPD